VSRGPAHPSTLGPTPLDDVQVDVTTRLGAPVEVTPTGFAGLDALMGGGLRGGMVLGLSGAPGSGKTSLALAMAYMAARTQAGVAFAGRAIDDTEIFARLAARALRRSYPASEVSYGDIWSGTAFQSDAVRRAINDAVGTVMQKVGAHLHLARLGPREPLSDFSARCAALWARHERVLVFVDDVEGLVVPERGSLDAQLVGIGYELRELAETGCTVVYTALSTHEEQLSPGTTVLVRAVPLEAQGGVRVPLELKVLKNRVGPTATLALDAVFGALEFSQGGVSPSGIG